MDRTQEVQAEFQAPVVFWRQKHFVALSVAQNAHKSILPAALLLLPFWSLKLVLKWDASSRDRGKRDGSISRGSNNLTALPTNRTEKRCSGTVYLTEMILAMTSNDAGTDKLHGVSKNVPPLTCHNVHAHDPIAIFFWQKCY